MRQAKVFIVLALCLALSGVATAATADGAAGPWADTVVSATQGLQKNGAAVLGDRSDTTDALGVAESTGTPYDAAVPGSFYSLGFGGTITLGFANSIVNGAGNDLRVYEVTGGTVYPDEIVKVEASHNGSDWVTLANSAVRDEDLDLGILPCAAYVRITDVSNAALFEAIADGYDLDGVIALHSSANPCNAVASVNVDKTASSSEVNVGEQVTYSYAVTNTGDFDLDSVVLVDDKCAPVTGPTGDDGDGVLEQNESWGYSCVATLNETTTNTATVTANDPFDDQVSDTDQVTVAVQFPGCTLTQGYWKNHATGSKHPDATWVGKEGYTLSGITWLTILKTPVKGDPWYILAHQYIAAKLNIAAGADPSAVSAAITQAEALFGTYGPNSVPKNIKNQFTSLASQLDQYNNGLIGPGHCSEL